MSINRIDKKIVMYLYNKVLYSDENIWTIAMCRNLSDFYKTQYGVKKIDIVIPFVWTSNTSNVIYGLISG